MFPFFVLPFCRPAASSSSQYSIICCGFCVWKFDLNRLKWLIVEYYHVAATLYARFLPYAKLEYWTWILLEVKKEELLLAFYYYRIDKVMLLRSLGSQVILWVSHEYNLCMNALYDDRTKSVEFHFFFLFSSLFACLFWFFISFAHFLQFARHHKLSLDWLGQERGESGDDKKTEYESAGIGKKSKPNQQPYNGMSKYTTVLHRVVLCYVLIFARVSCSYLMHSFVGLLSCR